MERKQKRDGNSNTKIEYSRGIIAIVAITLSLAKEARDFSIVDTNRTCFYRESREDKCSYHKYSYYKFTTIVGRVHVQT